MSILQFSYSILASFLISLYIFLPIPCTIILGIAFKNERTYKYIPSFFFIIVFLYCVLFMFYGKDVSNEAPLIAFILGIFSIIAIFASLICASIIDIILSRRDKL